MYFVFALLAPIHEYFTLQCCTPLTVQMPPTLRSHVLKRNLQTSLCVNPSNKEVSNTMQANKIALCMYYTWVYDCVLQKAFPKEKKFDSIFFFWQSQVYLETFAYIVDFKIEGKLYSYRNKSLQLLVCVRTFIRWP